MKYNNRSDGFSLLEVIIAVSIFAFVASAFVTGLGNSVSRSASFRLELTLGQLTEQVINQIILNPPKFSESLTLGKGETKTFEDYPDFQYTIKYSKFEIPDVEKILGEGGGEEGGEDSALSGVQKSLISKIKKNMEKMIWQVEVTVIKKEFPDFPFILTSWLLNDKAQVKLGMR